MEIGDYRLDVVSGGPFRLDGGSMFGIVPKALWERVSPPDERNRIRMDANCALIRGGGEVVLVDTGNGTKLKEKEQDIFALDPEVTLTGSLQAQGLRPEDVTMVLLTHLHMDHAGGGTLWADDGCAVPTFPNARYVVQRVEWEDALHHRSHMRISYRSENLLPLEESGQLRVLEGDTELLPGLRVQVSGGHTRGHQIVFLESGGRTAVCLGDICPLTTHLRPSYLMAYDLYPYDTMRFKMPLIERAAREEWVVVWDHDPDLPVGRIVDGGGGRFEGRGTE